MKGPRREGREKRPGPNPGQDREDSAPEGVEKEEPEREVGNQERRGPPKPPKEEVSLKANDVNSHTSKAG